MSNANIFTKSKVNVYTYFEKILSFLSKIFLSLNKSYYHFSIVFKKALEKLGISVPFLYTNRFRVGLFYP